MLMRRAGKGQVGRFFVWKTEGWMRRRQHRLQRQHSAPHRTLSVAPDLGCLTSSHVGQLSPFISPVSQLGATGNFGSALNAPFSQISLHLVHSVGSVVRRGGKPAGGTLLEGSGVCKAENLRIFSLHPWPELPSGFLHHSDRPM